MNSPTIGKIEQLTVRQMTSRQLDHLIAAAAADHLSKNMEATILSGPMIGITIQQFDEYQALRARAAETCTWNRIPDAGDDDDLYETSCEQEFQWLGHDTNALTFCWNCGRKVEVKP